MKQPCFKSSLIFLPYPFVSPHPYDKLIIHLRFLKITNDTISLNISSVVNDNVKYEGRVLEDGFVMSSLNALSHEVNEKGYFLMIKI